MKTTLTLLAHCLLLIAYCLLLIACCLLPTDASAQTTFQKLLSTNSEGGDVGVDIKQTADSGFIMGVNNGFAYRGTEIVSVVSLVKTNDSAEVRWVKSYRTLSYIACAEVQPTIDGGYIMVGLMKDDGYLDQMDGFVLKTDALGTIEWSKRLGRSNYQDYLTSVQQTSDSGYIMVGRTAGYGSGGINTQTSGSPGDEATDVWLIKLKNSGAVEWTKTYGNTNINEWGHTVRETRDGGFVISANRSDSVGTITGTGFKDGGGYNGLLLKTDNNGNLQWSKTYAVPDGVNDRPMAFFNSVQQTTTDKGFIVTGQAAEKESGTDVHGAWLLKLDSLGNAQWNKVYHAGDPFQSAGTKVFQLPGGGYVVETGFGLSVANNSTSGSGSVLVKTDASGNISWAKEYMANNSIIGNLPAMTLVKEGGYALFGYTYAGMNNNGNISGNFNDLFFVKADTNKCGPCRHTLLPRVFNPALTVTNVTLLVGSGISVSSTGMDEVGYTWQDTTGCFTSPVSANFFTNGICVNDSTQFANGSTGAALYRWNFGDPASGSADSSALFQPKHQYSASGTYTVILIATDGCGTPSDTIVKTLTIGSGNFLSSSPNVTICKGSSALLTASGATLHYWQPAYLYGDSISVSPDSTTIYRVSGDNGYCIDTDSVTVTVIGLPASISGQDTICSGDSTVLTVSGGSVWLWNTGATASSVSVNPPGNTSYWVAAFNGQCTDTAKITVEVLPKPLVNAGSDITVDYGNSIVLAASSGNAWQWNPAAGLSCTNCQSPTASPEITTVYYVTITDANGCINTDSVIVYVTIPCDNIEVFVPNAFSPNKDGGNDILYAGASITPCVQSIEFKIYDRWGNKVFESTKLTDGWDGTYKGKAMDPAVFVYYLTAALTNGNVISKKGNISLIK